MLVLLSNQGDPLTFVVLGTRFSEGNPQGSEGYDGQFAYQIARHPLSAAPYLDIPAYRYQRIFYPLLARLLAFGQTALIPWTLLLINVMAIGAGTWATEQLLLDLRVSRWHALTYGLYGGQLLSLRTDLNEPLAQAWVQLAILAWLKKRPFLMVVAFSLAALTKETTLIFYFGFWILDFGLTTKPTIQNLKSKIKNLTPLVPFLFYQIILWQWLGNHGVGSGGAGATSFSLVPLGGWLETAWLNLSAFFLISLIVVPMSILPALAGGWLSLRRLWQGEWHPYVVCLLLNSIILLCLPNSTFREPAAMARLSQGLVVSMLLYGGLTKSWRVLRYSSLWIFSGALLINGVA